MLSIRSFSRAGPSALALLVVDVDAEQDREDVLLRRLLLEAAQPQRPPAGLEPAGEVDAVALGEVAAAQALHRHAQRRHLAGTSRAAGP